MIVEIGVVADSAAQFVIGIEPPAMVHVGFHRLVPSPHVRIVGHASRPVHRLLDASAQQSVFESVAHSHNRWAPNNPRPESEGAPQATPSPRGVTPNPATFPKAAAAAPAPAVSIRRKAEALSSGAAAPRPRFEPIAAGPEPDPDIPDAPVPPPVPAAAADSDPPPPFNLAPENDGDPAGSRVLLRSSAPEAAHPWLISEVGIARYQISTCVQGQPRCLVLDRPSRRVLLDACEFEAAGTLEWWTKGAVEGCLFRHLRDGSTGDLVTACSRPDPNPGGAPQEPATD